MVDFKPNEKQEQEFKGMFAKKDLLGFNGNYSSQVRYRFPVDLLLKSNNQYNEVDVKMLLEYG